VLLAVRTDSTSPPTQRRDRCSRCCHSHGVKRPHKRRRRQRATSGRGPLKGGAWPEESPRPGAQKGHAPPVYESPLRDAEGAWPGLMLLGPRNEVELITRPPARELLDVMPSGIRSANGESPPSAVLALAEYTRRAPAGAVDEARTQRGVPE